MLNKRNGRDKNVDSWISEHDPHIREICSTIREIIFHAVKMVNERIKWSNPVYVKKSEIMYMSATDTYVEVGFFNGEMLTDTRKLVEKPGNKRLRILKIRSLKALDDRQLISWINQAVIIDKGLQNDFV